MTEAEIHAVLAEGNSAGVILDINLSFEENLKRIDARQLLSMVALGGVPDRKHNMQPVLYVPEMKDRLGLSSHPYHGLVDGLKRLVVTSCVILFFSACADGYSTEEELAINPV